MLLLDLFPQYASSIRDQKRKHIYRYQTALSPVAKLNIRSKHFLGA